MRIIAVTNQKGGVGKTTSVIHVGIGIARKGRRVLMIDIDPQGNLTKGLGIDTMGKKTIYEVLRPEDACPVSETIVHMDGYDVVPSDLRLCNAEMELFTVHARELLLKNAIEDIIDDYDYIFIDCPPALGTLTANAMVASTELMVALQPEAAALDGLSMLEKTIAALNKSLNKVMGLKVEITGVVITLYKSNTTIHQSFAEHAREYFGSRVFNTRIRDTVDFPVAYAQQKSIYDWKPSSGGAADYMALCDEIVGQEAK